MLKLILSGGLGNQMFQYAAARALSLRLGTDLAVDLYMFRKKTKAIPRNYELGVFGICLPVIDSFRNKLYIKFFKYLASNPMGRSMLDLVHVFNESHIQAYDERFGTLKPNTTLLGYFQNEKYFGGYADQIRRDFSFIPNLNSVNAETIQHINGTNSVSLHIRRGDYLNADSNLSVLEIDYYRKAIQFVKSKVNNPVFFVFSDDMDWAKKNLDIQESDHRYIDWNKGESSYIDMQLISSCKHNIIANSSFSWWGAWLNSHTDKLVIAPSVWYKNQTKHDFPDGFIPCEWIILE